MKSVMDCISNSDLQEDIAEGPLTMLIGKELFDSTNQAYFLKNSWHGTDHPLIDTYDQMHKLQCKFIDYRL